METLTQTETSQSLLEKIVEQLKNAPEETLAQVEALFPTTTEAVAETTEVDETADVPAAEIEAAPTAELPQEELDETADGTDLAVENGVEAFETENVATEEPTTEELQDAINEEETALEVTEPIVMLEPKADFEIRLDEIYSIRVVANEVVSSIEDLQNEVAALRTQVETTYTHEQLEAKVKEMVNAVLRERFV